MKRLFCVLSEIRPIPWFLTEGEVEVLVDPSTWTNLNTVEPGTNDRDYLSSLIVLQSYVRILLFYKRLKNISCEYDRLNGWNSTLQAAWCIRHVRWTWFFYISFIIWLSWTKPTIWLLILSFTKNTFARVLCFILMKDMGRWLPWMLPGSTGRFSITFLCTDTTI